MGHVDPSTADARPTRVRWHVVNMIGSVGGFVAGPVLGVLKEEYGWDGLFLEVGGAYLAAALCWLFINCTVRLRSASSTHRET